MAKNKIVLLAEACGKNTKAAILENGIFKAEICSDKLAMEAFAEVLNSVCNKCELSPADIDEFYICTGPGSILGTRCVSATLSTIAKISGAKIFVWDILEVGAKILQMRNTPQPFSLLAPSRKGFVNCILVKDDNILFERELDLSVTEEKSLIEKNSKLLNQKKSIDTALAAFELLDFTLKDACEVLKNDKDLLKEVKITPNAKSLSERIYVKWKAPALI